MAMFHVERGSEIRAQCKTQSRSNGTSNLVGRLAAVRQRLLGTDQEEPAQGMRYLDWFPPVPSRNLLNLGKVASANPENHLLRSYRIRGLPVKKNRKFPQRSSPYVSD